MADERTLSLILRLKDEASKGLQGITGQLDKMQPAFRSMALVGTAAFVAVGAAVGLSIKNYSDFNKAITKSTSIMGDLNEDVVREMERTARDVAKVTIFSAKQAADAYFYLASAGLGAAESMATLNTVAQFAQAGAFDLALATDLLTDAQSALGLTIRDDAIKNMENMVKVSDVLVKANTLANATVQQFSESLTAEAGAALKSFGIDVEEGVAVLAAFADQGVKGQIAGSGLSRVLRLLTKAANDNRKEMDDLGITVFDAEGEVRNLAFVIEDLESALMGMSDEQRTVALESIGFTARIQGIILPLLGTSDAIKEYEKALREAGGTTKDVADKQLEAFSAQMIMLKNKVADVTLTIGKTFAPILLDLVNKITPLIERMATWIEENPKLTINILIATAAISGLVAIVGIFGIMLPGLIAAGTAFGVMFSALTWPILGVIAIVAALIVIGILLRDVLKTLWNVAVEFLRPAIESLWESIKKFWASLKELWDLISPVLIPVLKFLAVVVLATLYGQILLVVGVVATLINIFVKMATFSMSTVTGVIESFIWMWEKIKEVVSWIGKVFSDFWGWLGDGFKGAVNFLIGLAEGWANVWINAINFIISALNKIKFSIPDWVPGIGGNRFGINIKKVAEIVLPRLAEGGIVNRPTAVLAGEAGPEAIIPLNRLAGAGIGGFTINVYGDIFSDRELVERIGEQLMHLLKRERRL